MNTVRAIIGMPIVALGLLLFITGAIVTVGLTRTALVLDKMSKGLE